MKPIALLLMEMVYLTTLEPRLGRDTVKNNNWAGLARSRDKKTEAYFEIFMPSSKVMRAKERRDIQVHSGALHLSQYRWSLKDWEGDLLATQHFMVSSQGEAVTRHSLGMGRYTLSRNIVMHDGSSVYKHDKTENYLYRNKNGNWCVGRTAGNMSCFFHQPMGNSSPTPSKTLPWKYGDEGEWKDDVTLRIYPCF